MRRNRCVEKRTSARRKRHTRPSYRGRGRGGKDRKFRFLWSAMHRETAPWNSTFRCNQVPPIPHLGWYMHFLFRSSSLASRVRWSRHLLWVHNSREIINNTCDDTRLDTRAWAASPHGHLKHSTTCTIARTMQKFDRSSPVWDLSISSKGNRF